MSRLSKSCYLFFICAVSTQSFAALADDASSIAPPAALSSDSGKVATGDENHQILPQNEKVEQGAATDGRPLLPERPDNFNPMSPPSMPDMSGTGTYPQSVNAPADMSALYMAQLAGTIGQLSFFTRGLLAGMIMLVLVLLGGVFYMRSVLGRTMRSVEATLMQTERARQEIASLKRLMRSVLSAQGNGNDFPDDDLSGA